MYEDLWAAVTHEEDGSIKLNICLSAGELDKIRYKVIPGTITDK